jgi:hypothetical protein
MNFTEKAMEEYLRETFFNASSLWKHGDVGRQRAERVLRLITLIDPLKIWVVLCAIYQTKAVKMKEILTGHIIYSGLLSPTLYDRVKRLKQSNSLEMANEKALVEIIHERMTTDTDGKTTHLQKYLDGEIDLDFEIIKKL